MANMHGVHSLYLTTSNKCSLGIFIHKSLTHLQLPLHSVDLLEGLRHDLTDQIILLCMVLSVLVVD